MTPRTSSRQVGWASLLAALAVVVAGAIAACEVPTHANDFATTAETLGCPATQRLCDTDAGPTCVDVANDSQNCGACNEACPATFSCSGGTCGCPANEELCGTTCSDPSTDGQHCGSCDIVCGTDHVCSGGQCLTTCQLNETNCNDTCANLSSDSQNCASCGTICTGQTVCVGAACISCDGGDCCPAGQTECADPNAGTTSCSDLQTNQHCGSCDNACLANETCTDGACVCDKGYHACPNGDNGTTCIAESVSSCGPSCAPCGGTIASQLSLGVESCDDGVCVFTPTDAGVGVGGGGGGGSDAGGGGTKKGST